MPDSNGLPRDGDGDGLIFDGTPRQRPAPSRATPAQAQRREPVGVPPGVTTRKIADHADTRVAIFDKALAAAQTIEPISDGRLELALEKVAYEDPEAISKAEQKASILEGRSPGRRLRGDWVLRRVADGQELDRRRSTIASVPYLSDDGTFVRNGISWVLANQMRLRPGVYARVKDNGELESHVNVLPGKGRSFRIFLEPETGKFQLQVGMARLPLAPILSALGATDAEIDKVWDRGLGAINRNQRDGGVIAKALARFTRDPAPADPGEQARVLREAFEGMRLDPEVTTHTLGRGHEAVTKDAVLDASRKLLAISRGQAETDDRDHLAFMTIHGPEDILSERLGRERGALRAALWKAARTDSLKSVPVGLLDKSISQGLLGSGLGQPSESINALMVLDNLSRVTRMGKGGIGSADAIPPESRAVQPSHLGFIDFVVTSESSKAGVDLRLASGVRKGSDGRLYARFLDARTGQEVWKSPQDLSKATVGFPDAAWRRGASAATFVPVVRDGRIDYVPKREVDFLLPHLEEAFSSVSNLVPFKSGIKGQRAVMAGRMITQALPLIGGEAPLVQNGDPMRPGSSYEQKIGTRMGAVRAEQGGVVEKVEPGAIKVRYDSGLRDTIELHQNTPFNMKTAIHQTALVGPGQRFATGALLARSNFTDGEGTAAVGLNARVAFVPGRHGTTFEDAIAVSRSFADRARSEHLYQHEVRHEPGVRAGKARYAGAFPSRYSAKQLEALDDDGVIRVGATVHHGDPLVLAVGERKRSYDPVHKGRGGALRDASESWEHETEGVVTDVAKTNKGIVVAVRTEVPMQDGDKLSGRAGNKGVVRVVPDDEMPKDSDGKPFEVLMNPLGLISRTNPAQVAELALGKVAMRTGKPYRIADFGDGGVEHLIKFAQHELKTNGLDPSGREQVVDPRTGRPVRDWKGRNPIAGSMFVMKLHHTSESKEQGRGLGAYTADGTPARAGEAKSKRLAMSDLNALLSSGAHEVIRAAGAIRGQDSAGYWSQVMAGFDPPPPKVPQVYQKFINLLRGGGLNPTRSGNRMRLMALTSADIDELAADREVKNAETVDWDALEPVPGGLFDPKLTGGHSGTAWAAIKLAEPMPNPVMEGPIRAVLGLTEKKYREALSGAGSIDGESGPGAILKALEKIDLGPAIAKAEADIESGRKSERDAAVKRYNYLSAAQRLKIHPKDWVWDRVPVLPPKFRPVSVMGGTGTPLVADPNLLYRELFDANDALSKAGGLYGDTAEERLAVYDSMKAVTGLGDPITPQLQEKQVSGVLRQVFGEGSAKFGFVQRKLLGSAVDLVGRGVIVPDANLDMDTVGVPEEIAWSSYGPFVVRRLVRAGMDRVAAVRKVRDRSDEARRSLLEEMEKRPVIVTRAPTLHRYGLIGQRPKLITGSSIRINPLIVGGLGADYDGDQMNVHVVSSDGEIQDVLEKLLPSRNLLNPATMKVHHVPKNEFVQGLYAATTAKPSDKRPHRYFDAQEALKALRRGELDLSDTVAVPDFD